MGIKDEWECALDASEDTIKSHTTNESLVLFSFLSDFIALAHTEVSTFSDEGWVSEVSSSLFTLYQCSSSRHFLKGCFLKEEDSGIRRDFGFRLEVFDYWLEE